MAGIMGIPGTGDRNCPMGIMAKANVGEIKARKSNGHKRPLDMIEVLTGVKCRRIRSMPITTIRRFSTEDKEMSR
ncbi:hypothetical protein SDC9_149811 [bioreactor metagenome]|uniref:Uncharacterized protein n=1 Tax=bioreactor metagenome TaxID=1076179 RepID=A0A645EKN2_9ZZZZ